LIYFSLNEYEKSESRLKNIMNDTKKRYALFELLAYGRKTKHNKTII
jgi:hypothetical protein